MPNFTPRSERERPPFTLEEKVNIALGKAYFWYFLEHIFITSFDGEVYTDPKSKQPTPYKFTRLHREWAILAQMFPRFAIQAPRAHLKTTVIGQAFPFWLMFRSAENTLVDGMYFSYKAELANEKLRDLKRIIRSNSYTRFWRDLKPTSDSVLDYLIDWGNGPIAEATLKGSGIMSATRGRHPKFTICDDILSDFSNPLSSTELQLINRIFRQVIMSLPADEKDILCLIGTPQSYDDILYQLATSEEWLWLIYPAVTDWIEETTQWPEKFDFDRLMRIRSQIKPTAFEVEYQLTPITVTDQFLTREDVLMSVDSELEPWPLEEAFPNADRLGIYGGLDVGKLVHPSHVVLFLELPDGTLIMLYQFFMDHLNYPKQVKLLNFIANRFNLSKGYFDQTNNVLDDRGLDSRWQGKAFNRKLKGDLATGLEKRLLAEEDQPGMVLLNVPRMIDQMLVVRKDLSAPATVDGHGDSFWSVALAVRAADDGPSFLDIGSPDRRSVMGTIESSSLKAARRA